MPKTKPTEEPQSVGHRLIDAAQDHPVIALFIVAVIVGGFVDAIRALAGH